VEDVLECIQKLKSKFTLDDLYAFESELRMFHPRNRHIRPKIRQQLQYLRNAGLVEFVGQGNYLYLGEQTRIVSGLPRSEGESLKIKASSIFSMSGDVSIPKWYAFEKNVLKLLQNCEFDFIAGGPRFKVGEKKRQIDAMAVFRNNGKNYFFFFDAHAAEERKFVNLKRKITDFNDIKTDIIQELEKRGNISIDMFESANGYKQASTVSLKSTDKVFFILALEDYEYDEISAANAKKYGIRIWSSKYSKLSFKLGKMIGECAKYTLLREMNDNEIDLSFADEQGSKIRSYTAFTVDLTGENIGSVYLFPMSPQYLLKIAYVYRRETSGMAKDDFRTAKEDDRVYESYQRMLRGYKLTEIKKFLNDEDGSFKNNIIIVFREEPRKQKVTTASVDGSASVVEIKIPNEYASVRVLDGQHRLYGYYGSNSSNMKKNLLVSAFASVGNEEAKTFLSINRNQTPVEPNLLWDLYSITQPETTEGSISLTVKTLNLTKNDNPFFKTIEVPSDEKGSDAYNLKMGNLCKTILDTNLLTRPDDLKGKRLTLWKDNYAQTATTAVKVLRVYFNAIEDILAEDSQKWFQKFFMQNNGFNAAVRVLVEVLQYLGSERIEDYEYVEHLLKKGLLRWTDNNNPQNTRQRTSSEAGRATVASEIAYNIWLFNSDFAVGYLKNRLKPYFYSTPKEYIESITWNLRILTDSVLEPVESWWETMVPLRIKDYALKVAEKKYESPLKEKRLLRITEGDLVNIVEMIYASKLQNTFKQEFPEPKDFNKKAQEFLRLRNDIDHQGMIKSEDMNFLFAFNKSISICMQRLFPEKPAELAPGLLVKR
jgi:DGQHR domain-containing protein